MIKPTCNDLELIETYGLKDSSVFRYGSRKEGEKVKGSMVDHIFSVPSIRKFHEKNIRENCTDYSNITRLLGINFIERLQKMGAGIFYHPFVKFGDDIIKYGVIQEDELIKDLTEWTSMYCAGRLQKPVQTICATSKIQTAIRTNLEHALNTALFLLPEEFSDEELFLMISNLSYMGDSRMKHGEDPKKTRKIVENQIDTFRTLYADILKKHEGIKISTDLSGTMQQDISPNAQELLFNNLPINIINKIDRPKSFEAREKNARLIIERISSIVWASSMQQSLIGIFSSGLRRTLRYVRAKREKRRLSINPI